MKNKNLRDRSHLIRDLQRRLEKIANAKTKAWWERYLKQIIPFRGVKMDGIRSVLHTWYAQNKIADTLTPGMQKKLALALFREKHAEDKLAGILFFQAILEPQGQVDWRKDQEDFAQLFRDGHIFDWNICDWLCVRVLGPLIQQVGKPCAQALSEWRKAGNLWQRRASVVAFVNLAKRGNGNFRGFTPMLLRNCSVVLKHPERFSKTGVGWVLRELAQSDVDTVIAFIDTNLESFSRESLNNATKHMPDKTRQRLIQSLSRASSE